MSKAKNWFSNIKAETDTENWFGNINADVATIGPPKTELNLDGLQDRINTSSGEQQRLAQIQIGSINPLSSTDSLNANQVATFNEQLKEVDNILLKKSAIEEVKQKGSLTDKANAVANLTEQELGMPKVDAKIDSFTSVLGGLDNNPQVDLDSLRGVIDFNRAKQDSLGYEMGLHDSEIRTDPSGMRSPQTSVTPSVQEFNRMVPEYNSYNSEEEIKQYNKLREKIINPYNLPKDVVDRAYAIGKGDKVGGVNVGGSVIYPKEQPINVFGLPKDNTPPISEEEYNKPLTPIDKSLLGISTDTPIGRLGGSFVQGFTGLGESGMGVVEWIGSQTGLEGVENFGKETGDKINEFTRTFAPDDPNFAESLSSGVASMIAFGGVGFGVGKGITAGLKAFSKVSPKLAKWGILGAMTGMESIQEAGSVYRESRNDGVSKDESSDAALKTLIANAILIGVTNKLGILGDKLDGLKKALVSAPLEGLQEGGQSIISSLTQGKEIDVEEVLKSGTIGTIIGGGAGMVLGNQAQQLQSEIDPLRQEQSETSRQEQASPLRTDVAPQGDVSRMRYEIDPNQTTDRGFTSFPTDKKGFILDDSNVTPLQPKAQKGVTNEELPLDLNRPPIKDRNNEQADLMKDAGIPEEKMTDYVLDSFADGKKLGEYADEVMKGEITHEEASNKVKADFDKMIDGRKEAPNLQEDIKKEQLTSASLDKINDAETPLKNPTSVKPERLESNNVRSSTISEANHKLENDESFSDGKDIKQKINMQASWEKDGYELHKDSKGNFDVIGGENGNYHGVPKAEITKAIKKILTQKAKKDNSLKRGDIQFNRYKKTGSYYADYNGGEIRISDHGDKFDNAEKDYEFTAIDGVGFYYKNNYRDLVFEDKNALRKFRKIEDEIKSRIDTPEDRIAGQTEGATPTPTVAPNVSSLPQGRGAKKASQTVPVKQSDISKMETTEKQPYEMTRGELNRGEWRSITPEEVSSLSSIKQSNSTNLKLAKLGDNGVYAKTDTDGNIIGEWEILTKAAKKLYTKDEHKNVIAQALSEGKKVPQEVLKDYPELTKTYNNQINSPEKQPKNEQTPTVSESELNKTSKQPTNKKQLDVNLDDKAQIESKKQDNLDVNLRDVYNGAGDELQKRRKPTNMLTLDQAKKTKIRLEGKATTPNGLNGKEKQILAKIDRFIEQKENPTIKESLQVQSDIEVRHNDKKKGVEIVFNNGKPTEEQIAKMRKVQFREKKGENYWYAKTSPNRRAVADEMVSGSLKENLGSGLEIKPKKKPSMTKREPQSQEEYILQYFVGGGSVNPTETMGYKEFAESFGLTQFQVSKKGASLDTFLDGMLTDAQYNDPNFSQEETVMNVLRKHPSHEQRVKALKIKQSNEIELTDKDKAWTEQENKKAEQEFKEAESKKTPLDKIKKDIENAKFELENMVEFDIGATTEDVSRLMDKVSKLEAEEKKLKEQANEQEIEGIGRAYGRPSSEIREFAKNIENKARTAKTEKELDEALNGINTFFGDKGKEKRTADDLYNSRYAKHTPKKPTDRADLVKRQTSIKEAIKNAKGKELVKVKDELKRINNELAKLDNGENLFDGDVSKPLFQKANTETKEFKEWFGKSKVVDKNDPNILHQNKQPLSTLSKEELNKELELANKFLDGVTVEFDTNIKDENGNAVMGLTDVKTGVIKINPNLANKTTMMHEITHQATKQVLMTNRGRGRALLRLGGWDGKGDPLDFSNESTVKAWEHLSKKGEEYFTDEKKFMENEPRARWYKEFFDKLKQLWESAKNYFKGEGFTSEAKFYEDLLKGKFKNPTDIVGEPSLIYQKLKDAFYSKVEQLVNSKAPNKNIRKEQLMPMLEKNGAKKAELEWLDIESFLEENPKATKQDLLDYIKKNNVKIDVVELGDEYGKIAKEISKELGVRLNDIPTLRHLEKHSKNKTTDKVRQLYDKLGKADNNEQTRNESWKAVKGGENYREIVLTMPGQIEPFNTSDQTHYGDVGDGTAVVWLRVDDRQTELGKTLNIQEVQSKRAEEGRRRGYKDKGKSIIAEKEFNDFRRSMRAKYGDGLFKQMNRAELSKEMRLMETKDTARRILNDGVPSFPYKTTYHELGLKHALRRAVEEGYDAVSWVTGEQTADLYDLSKKIDEVSFNKQGDKYAVTFLDKEGKLHDAGKFEKEKLSGVVGKELADKIIGSNKSNDVYSGVDLKVGGEWAVNLYDRTIVNYMNKFGKKFGAKTKHLEVQTENEGTVWEVKASEDDAPQTIRNKTEADQFKQNGYIVKEIKDSGIKPIHSIPITPKMRESVLEGMPLFQQTKSEIDKAIKKQSQRITTPKIGKGVPKEKTYGLKNKESEKIRARLNYGSMNKGEQQSAKELIYNVEKNNLAKDAIFIAKNILDNPRTIDPLEYMAMQVRQVEIENELTDVASISTQRFNQLNEEYKTLFDASDLGGTKNSQGLGIRRFGLTNSFNLANTIVEARNAKGKRLTDAESKRLTDLHNEVTKLRELRNAEYEKYKKDLEEKERKFAERIAEIEAKRFQKGQRKKQTKIEAVNSEIADIKGNLRALGIRVNDIVGLTAEGYYEVGKLAMAYIKKAAIETEGRADLNKIIKDIQRDIPDISKADIHKALNTRNPSIQRKAKTAVEKNISNIKRQATLEDKIQKAEEGIFSEPTKRGETPNEIKKLQSYYNELRAKAYQNITDSNKLSKALDKLAELQDQLDGHYRDIKKKRKTDPIELAEIKKKSNEIRRLMHYKDRLTELEDQINKNEFKIEEKVEPTVYPKDLTKADYEVRKAQKKIKDAIRELKPITKLGVATKAIQVARTAKASMDVSAAMRQGILAMSNNPKEFGKAYWKALGSFVNEEKYETIQKQIEDHPNAKVRDAAGLVINDINNMNTKEEFMLGSDVLEKIPIYGSGIKASNRNMTTMLNLTRSTMFDNFLEIYPNATMKELKAWADYVNVTTGVGNLGKASGIADGLSTVFFAPKFAMSRIQYPYQVVKHWSEPRVRKEVAKNQVKNLAIASMIISLAMLAGGEVGFDETDSDFLKIKIGNTRWDIFAGLMQPLRVTLGILSGSSKDPLRDIQRFGSYKLSPGFTIPLEIYRGKTIIGEERKLWETIGYGMTPMTFEDIYDAYEIEGATQGGLLTIPILSGANINTYRRRVKKSKPKTTSPTNTRRTPSRKAPKRERPTRIR